MTPTTGQRIDVALCDPLVQRIVAGDEEAWRPLAEHLWPHFIDLVKKSRHMGSLAKSEDHVHNVVANLVDKLGTDGGRAINKFPSWQADNPGKGFDDWIRIVVSFTVKDYVRQALGRRSRAATSDKTSEEELPSIKRLLNEFSTSPAGEEAFGSARPPMTAAQTARELFDYARSRLPADQMEALSQWMDGASFEEIDAHLASRLPDAADARKLVRAAMATLRRKFGTSEP